MAPKLFRNATIISFDEDAQSIKVLRDTDVLVKNDTIAAIEKDIQSPDEAEVVDATNKILSPGFIDTHTHLWQTALRTLAPDTTLAEYFSSYSHYSPLSASFSPEDLYISTLAGILEALNGGTTTLLEHAHNNWSVDAVKRGYDAGVQSGARMWWCCAAEHRNGITDEEMLEALGQRHRSGNEGGLMELGLAWDGMGTQSEEEVERVKGLVRKHDLKALTLHHLGSPWPFDNSPSLAASPPKSLQSLNLPTIFSHAGFATPADISALRKHNWHLSITPESELHYGHGQQTSRLVQDQASLGIDTSFTFSGDLLTQARIWLQTARGTEYNRALGTGKIPDRNPMKVEEAFLLATRQGALALRREDLGVLRVGAKADIVCFSGEAPNMAGWSDPVAAVILHANVGDVRDVMVGGEWRKREGELMLKEGTWKAFREGFVEVARRVQRENERPQALGEKFMGVGEWADVEIMGTRRREG
ncbi:uncharacterized protein LTR77_007465 [Saxophila tyrrhenica]|uniref:Amidohydrolase-related domain-containing protein n=1 Tax=Saxophila tyrrhenica TaxID=1690608 RepID=A0AAV9P6R5_9PEZI|nr:hypothetical protein LTR77_007465 [Saxophila tyrrhenica]